VINIVWDYTSQQAVDMNEPQSCRPPFQLLHNPQLQDGTFFKYWYLSFICGLLAMIVAQATFEIACFGMIRVIGCRGLAVHANMVMGVHLPAGNMPRGGPD